MQAFQLQENHDTIGRYGATAERKLITVVFVLKFQMAKTIPLKQFQIAHFMLGVT